MTIIKERSLIPDHQYGFRQQHGTTEQVHRLVNEIDKAFETKKFCTVAFLDITQAFDRVWHDELLYMIKKLSQLNITTLSDLVWDTDIF